MNTAPQEVLSYRDLARQRARISRQTSLDQFSRLALLLAGDNRGSLDVNMAFERDAQGLVRVTGDVAGSLALTCYGCAEVLDYQLDVSFDCVIVSSDDLASEMGSADDVLVAEGPEISVAGIVEDEILLSIPERLCTSEPCDRAPLLQYPATGVAEVIPTQAEEEDNPFNVLAELKLATKKTSPD